MFGPEFAMLKMPRPEWDRNCLNSSAKAPFQKESPPVPVPVGSPPCTCFKSVLRKNASKYLNWNQARLGMQQLSSWKVRRCWRLQKELIGEKHKLATNYNCENHACRKWRLEQKLTYFRFLHAWNANMAPLKSERQLCRCGAHWKKACLTIKWRIERWNLVPL